MEVRGVEGEGEALPGILDASRDGEETTNPGVQRAAGYSAPGRRRGRMGGEGAARRWGAPTRGLMTLITLIKRRERPVRGRWGRGGVGVLLLHREAPAVRCVPPPGGNSVFLVGHQPRCAQLLGLPWPKVSQNR